VRAIIPCAGFGTRMGRKPNESKEMMIDPVTGDPLIQYSLNLCKQYGLQPLIVTRPEKTILVDYCEADDVEVLEIEPSGEWPNTILMSKMLWHENNILILPDTRFNSTEVINQMKRGLMDDWDSINFALHKVSDHTKWCMVNSAEIVEKPSEQLSPWSQAMGLIGFKDYMGESLFKALSTRNRSYCLDKERYDYGNYFLDNFIDITRSGKLELY
jgi:dTDP-glucose pyrophosphorylase